MVKIFHLSSSGGVTNTSSGYPTFGCDWSSGASEWMFLLLTYNIPTSCLSLALQPQIITFICQYLNSSATPAVLCSLLFPGNYIPSFLPGHRRQYIVNASQWTVELQEEVNKTIYCLLVEWRYSTWEGISLQTISSQEYARNVALHHVIYRIHLHILM